MGEPLYAFVLGALGFALGYAVVELRDQYMSWVGPKVPRVWHRLLRVSFLLVAILAVGGAAQSLEWGAPRDSFFVCSLAGFCTAIALRFVRWSRRRDR